MNEGKKLTLRNQSILINYYLFMYGGNRNKYFCFNLILFVDYGLIDRSILITIKTIKALIYIYINSNLM